MNLKLLSSSAYHSLRTSGFMKLPSERTLRDYTHFFKSTTGFQGDVDAMLKRELRLEELDSSDANRYVILLIDEIKIKESLVYDKFSSQVIGFVELDNIDEHVERIQQLYSGQSANLPKTVATHVQAIMVRGLFTSCKFPLAHFPTSSITGDQLFTIVWEAVERLERIGLKVLAITADGAGPNRKFFHLHFNSTKKQVCYKTTNPYTKESRPIYFFCDVPHLMKTTRNCWSHSGTNGTRSMWVSTYV